MPSEEEKLRLWHEGPEFLKTGQYHEKTIDAGNIEMDEEYTVLLDKTRSTDRDDVITRYGTYCSELRFVFILVSAVTSKLNRTFNRVT